MKKSFVALASFFLMFGFVFAADAVAVKSGQCTIDVTDGHTQDWQNIPFLVKDEASVEGTGYYLDSEGEWTTDEPDDYRISINPAQWADVTRMKICNSADDVFINMQSAWPMMTYLDNLGTKNTNDDRYVDFGYPTYDGTQISMPEDFDYWMNWKFQKADGSGDIIYFSAHIVMGLDEGDESLENNPQLALYQESDTDVDFEDAELNPDEDTFLSDVALTGHKVELDTDELDCDINSEECRFETNPEEIGLTRKKDQAMEIQQGLGKFFKFADFSYGDTVNVALSMINNDVFSASSLGVTAADNSKTKKYKFTKKGVTKVKQFKKGKKKKSNKIRWTKFKNAVSYEVKVYNASTGKVVATKTGVKKPKTRVKGLSAGTEYYTQVRALKKNQKYSAWSSAFYFTTKTKKSKK